MKLWLKGHDERYAVEQMMLTLFPGQRPDYPPGEPDGTSPAACLTLTDEGARMEARALLWWEGRCYEACRDYGKDELSGVLEDQRLRRQAIRLAFYDAGVQALGAEPPWGALTGVRPVKIPTRHMEQGAGRAQAKARLTQLYRVSEARAELAMECADAALKVKQGLGEDTLSLYIGIPFCPTRCAYCSFISADVGRALSMVEPYVEALCREIELAGRLMKEAGVRVSAAYMGGGTPTTLSASQLARILDAVYSCLPMDRCIEFTVEAGRPDTITAEKLETLRDRGIGRISVNPQTMEDSVLRAMGRAHTAADIEEAMDLARRHFGGMVNMDLIAGLPADTLEGFARTLDRALAFAPANITVHTLALKKGARLMEQTQDLCPPETVADMLALGTERLRRAGYAPYYLYRQKYMSGSFENVGWCRPGAVCAYNIVMMEELQSVLSLGAGGVSKLVGAGTGKIVRFANPKYPGEYLDSWDKVSSSKRLFMAEEAGRSLPAR